MRTSVFESYYFELQRNEKPRNEMRRFRGSNGHYFLQQVNPMKIYTRFGDTGDTRLLGGVTTRKNDLRVALCGSLDELNATLGVVASWEASAELSNQIATIQSDLFKIGGTIAKIDIDTSFRVPAIKEDDSKRLENEIDKMDSQLSSLDKFLLPGGNRAAAAMHVSRAVCRRVERQLADVSDQFERFDSALLFQYLNRLGDWCFVAARYLNHLQNTAEPVWEGRGG